MSPKPDWGSAKEHGGSSQYIPEGPPERELLLQLARDRYPAVALSDCTHSHLRDRLSANFHCSLPVSALMAYRFASCGHHTHHPQQGLLVMGGGGGDDEASRG